MEKTIVILAKSYKNGAYCIAGKDLETREWIRIVSDKNGGAISNEQSMITFDGANKCYPCQVLNQVTIDFIEPVPLSYHPENHLISDQQWIHKYNYQGGLDFLCDGFLTLWGVGNKIKCNERHTAYTAHEPIESPYFWSSVFPITRDIGESLYLAKVTDLRLYMMGNKRKVAFTYNEHFEYTDWACTDPKFDSILQAYGEKPDGELYDFYIVASLGQPFEGYHYKLAASILIFPKGSQEFDQRKFDENLHRVYSNSVNGSFYG